MKQSRTRRPPDIDRAGPVIETRLEPGRRHAAGQHFTGPDVADLVNALCIRTPRDIVVDPACGTGSFLFRARARLRHLGGGPAAGRGLIGVELDPDLAQAARRGLPEADIITGDFLEEGGGGLPSRGCADAVVGNPPYVRQELVCPSRKKELRRRLPGASLRSDLHVYFWPRALDLLRDGGRLGLVTSASWLDASYGGALRRWLIDRHTMVAVIEPEAESWFDDARVRAVVTIVEKAPPRDGGAIRFIRLKRRLSEVAPRDLPEDERLARFQALANDLESGGGGRAVGTRPVSVASLRAGRWGPLLRQPDLHFELIEAARPRLVPLSEIAGVGWGIKTGDDGFFILRGDEEADVEERFLAPVVFSLMDLGRLVVTRDQLARRILLVDLRRTPAGPALARRIERAEREGRSHLRPTCAARERGGVTPRRWFELRPGPPGEILWSIMHQYRHLVPWNPERFPVNDNLLQIRPRPGVDPKLLAALLNSHVQALIKHAHGRQRHEGMLKTQAADVAGMPVPDPRQAGPDQAARLLEAFDAIASRAVGPVREESLREDRRRLDAATLSLLGYPPGRAEDMTGRIGETLEGIYETERRGEVDAVGRRRRRPPLRTDPEV